MEKTRDNYGLSIRGIDYDPKTVNQLRMFTKESLEHWTTKSMVFHILRKMNHTVLSEFTIPGVGQGDILDLTTNVQYEIETVNNRNYHARRVEHYKRAGVDVVVIPTKGLPQDIKQRYKAIQVYIHPD